KACSPLQFCHLLCLKAKRVFALAIWPVIAKKNWPKCLKYYQLRKRNSIFQGRDTKMSVEVQKVDSPSKLRRFINLPWSLYQNYPHWVPQLKMAIHDLFKPTHPFYETGTMVSWIAVRDGKDV